jgi:NodT family efflux transporter outer membrane factor (OMF) lipoprotein
MRTADRRPRSHCRLALLAGALLLAGCTTLSDYVHNGFKVGPNYHRPPVPAADHWIDAADPRVGSVPVDDSHWWTAFHDPVLDSLVKAAYQQNLPLRAAGFRVLESRAKLCISVGNLFPQSQQLTADYDRHGVSVTVANRVATPVRWFNIWDVGFNLSWEIDFWGQFRRAIEAACADFDASIENYDAVLVTLVADVGQAYTQLRIAQQQLVYVHTNIELQKKTLDLVNERYKAGAADLVDVEQAKANLARTEALAPPLLVQIRQYSDQLCTLLGIPMEDLTKQLSIAPIPVPPSALPVGFPPDLIKRRPDVRQAERQVAAQSARIGVAVADFYPAMGIGASIGYQTSFLKDLFSDQSIRGTWGPFFSWPILNYGRLLNAVREQEAIFQELVATYQNTLLTANQEVENGLVLFLQSQEQAADQQRAVTAVRKSVDLFLIQYKEGKIALNPLYLLERDLVNYEIDYATAQGNIALGLIQVYRALGGGWQIRLEDGACVSHEGAVPGDMPPTEASLPAPRPLPDQPKDKNEVLPVKPVPDQPKEKKGSAAREAPDLAGDISRWVPSNGGGVR